jgi:hypothetical protein
MLNLSNVVQKIEKDRNKKKRKIGNERNRKREK